MIAPCETTGIGLILDPAVSTPANNFSSFFFGLGSSFSNDSYCCCYAHRCACTFPTGAVVGPTKPGCRS